MVFKEMFHSLNWHKLKPKKELTEVYISISLRYLAFSMINLFIPLYLYDKLGYSLNQTLFFYVLYAASFAIFTIPAAKLVSRIGVKHTILSAVPFYLIFYLLLYGMESYKIPFLIVPLFYSFAQSLFWMGFHTEFIKSSNHDHRGKEVGRYISLTYIAVLIGPLSGGYLIDKFGFALLFLVVAVLFLLSASFLFFTKDFREPSKIHLKHIFSRDNLRNSFAFMGYGAQTMAEGILWPLFIFVILKTYTNLGLLGSAMSAVIALVTVLVGRVGDKYNHRDILYIGSLVYSLTWLVRTLFNSIGFVFGVSIFSGVSYAFVHVPMETITYNKAEKNIVEILVFREMALNVGRVAVLLVVMLTGSFWAGFLLAALAGLGYLFF